MQGYARILAITGNPRAAKFYHRHGFKEVAARTVAVSDDGHTSALS